MLHTAFFSSKFMKNISLLKALKVYVVKKQFKFVSPSISLMQDFVCLFLFLQNSCNGELLYKTIHFTFRLHFSILLSKNCL